MQLIKSEIKESVIDRLRAEQYKIRLKLNLNKNKINLLAKENTKLKRELVEIEELIRSVVTNIKKNEEKELSEALEFDDSIPF